MKILVIGRDGQVGKELVAELPALGGVIATSRADLDLEDPSRLASVIRSLKPDVIVNAAAYTAVDRAESEPELAYSINALAPGLLADEARRTGAFLVHYSTDYVFDGLSQRPYREEDPTAPLNVYGRTKREGELAILGSGCRHLILRTSWVYSGQGHNFLLSMLKLARKAHPARVVADQHGAPTWARFVAQATARALPVALRDSGGELLHLSASGQTSWHGFAEKIYRWVDSDAVVEPIPSSAWPTPAVRPAWSVLDNSRFAARFGYSPENWQTQFEQAMLALGFPRIQKD